METIKTRLNQILFAAFLISFLAIGNISAKGTELAAFPGLENTVETKLEMENWMIQGHHWETYENAYLEEASAPSFMVKLCIIDENNWFVKRNDFQFPVTEEPLKIEKWMVNGDNWN